MFQMRCQALLMGDARSKRDTDKKETSAVDVMLCTIWARSATCAARQAGGIAMCMKVPAREGIADEPPGVVLSPRAKR